MSEHYALFRVNKLKTYDALNKTFEHNHRKTNVMNADTEHHENRIVVNVEEKNLTDLYREAIDTDYYKQKGHTIRKDAVKAIEIIFSYTRDADIDEEKWIQTNLDFVAKNFGGKDNIKSAVVHNDENSKHMHVVLVAITPDGRLCSYAYLKGPSQLRKLQDKYGEAVQPLGLKRGFSAKSGMKHRDIKKFYADWGSVLSDDLPAIRQDETIEAYYDRANRYHKTGLKQKFKGLLDEISQMNKRYGKRQNYFRAWKDYYELVKKYYKTIKKATKAIEEKFYLDYGLLYLQQNDPEQYETYKTDVERLIEAGKIFEKGIATQKKIDAINNSKEKINS